MGFVGSYLWRLRQRVGHAPVLMPGAMVLVVDAQDRLLLTRRSDTDEWCFPAGAAEEGGSFAQTALDELREETGLRAAAEDLVPFGCLSEAAQHTITYPNGDVTHCFALLFLLRRWTGTPRATDEAVELAFFQVTAPPSPLQAPAATALALYRRYLATGTFQVR